MAVEGFRIKNEKKKAKQLNFFQKMMDFTMKKDEETDQIQFEIVKERDMKFDSLEAFLKTINVITFMKVLPLEGESIALFLNTRSKFLKEAYSQEKDQNGPMAYKLEEKLEEQSQEHYYFLNIDLASG